VRLVEDGFVAKAALNIVGSVAVGLLACWCGWALMVALG
jgi:fluoride ion exporter CrcB/FEX